MGTNDSGGSLPLKPTSHSPGRIKQACEFPAETRRIERLRASSQGRRLLAWAGNSARAILNIVIGNRSSNQVGPRFDHKLATRLGVPTKSNEPGIEETKLSKHRPGPIRHESLTEDQLERVRAIYECISPYLGTAFEQFELNFFRDLYPAREIRIWGCIALAHQTFLQRRPDATESEAQHAFKAFLLMSMGAPRPNEIPAPLWESLEAIYER